MGVKFLKEQDSSCVGGIGRCMYIHVYMLVEGQDRPQIHSFQIGSFTSLRLPVRLVWLAKRSPSNLPSKTTCLVLVLQGLTTMPSILMWVLKTALGSSCLRGKGFTDGAIFQSWIKLLSPDSGTADFSLSPAQMHCHPVGFIRVERVGEGHTG